MRGFLKHIAPLCDPEILLGMTSISQRQNGKKCKFLGTSMDQSYLAIDGVPDVVLNNEVTLLGKDGDYEITPFDWRDFTGQSFVFLNSIRNVSIKRNWCVSSGS